MFFLTVCCVDCLADDTRFRGVHIGHYPLGVIFFRDLAWDSPLCGNSYRHRYVDGLLVLDSLVDDEAFSMNL